MDPLCRIEFPSLIGVEGTLRRIEVSSTIEATERNAAALSSTCAYINSLSSRSNVCIGVSHGSPSTSCRSLLKSSRWLRTSCREARCRVSAISTRASNRITAPRGLEAFVWSCEALRAAALTDDSAKPRSAVTRASRAASVRQACCSASRLRRHCRCGSLL